MNWYYHRRTGLDMVRFWKEVGVIYVIPVLMCVAAILLGRIIDYNTLWIMLAGIVVYTLIFAGLNWCFVMNAYEKGLVKGFWKRKSI